MRILYLIDTLAFGGAERQFLELVRGVSKLEEIEPFVGYFTERAQGYKSQLVTLGIPVNLFERTKKYDTGLIFKIRHYCLKNKIDLIHSFSTLAGLVAVICGKLCGIPVVASTIRNSKDTDLKAYPSIRLQSFLADCFVANSHAGFKNRFKKMKANFRVIYNGINLKRFRINPAESQKVRKIYNLDRFKHVVSMVASLSRNKDFDTFIDAIPLVLKAKPDTVFLLVGDGSERSRLEEKVFDLSISNNVIFTGYTHDVIGILANTDVSVLMTNASRIVEGISNSLLESMAVGVPVIASRGGGTDEIIENGVNGILVDPYDTGNLAKGIIRI
ncbi:MAG: glycosyltransferase, partial [Deltaproteobacteria bacterium]|nr:glycosyltransferase [Deltaproteobacteria bacterium]